ncbi:hypothetical protein L1887_59798 [Cichorium endivia]|nr:hypothetical protein L1887_59798 [Cichorium endivia]
MKRPTCGCGSKKRRGANPDSVNTVAQKTNTRRDSRTTICSHEDTASIIERRANIPTAMDSDGARQSGDQARPAPQRTEHAPNHSADPFFRVRLINIDHVLTLPGPLDRTQCAFNAEGQLLRKVPILRIFGATPAGQRVCIHVHNVFPYCYIQYKGSLDPDDVLRYIHRLGRELNAAMAASLRRNAADPEANQFIAAIHLCKGINFYGYHVGYSYFLKISFVDPSHSYRIATILESGGVMKTIFQPFEIHIRYQLQFMLDYNIFGCDYLDLDDVRFRLPVPEGSMVASDEPSPSDARSKVWNRNTIPYAQLQSEDVHRATYCEIEADISAPWIINRRRLRQRPLHQDFDEPLRVSPDQNILVPSLSGLWEGEKARRSAAGLPASIPTEDPARDPRAYAEGESPSWNAEDRMRLLLEKRLLDEKQKTLPRERVPNHFTDRSGLDQYIMTTFDAVEVFHPYQDQIHAADPYSQRTGPSASFKLYDLEHMLSQTQRGKNGTSSQDAETDDDFDTKLFKSQEFNHRLMQAEKEDVAGIHDPPSDHDEDSNDVDASDPAEGQAGDQSPSRAWKRTDSANSVTSTSNGSTFGRSPSSTPKKRRIGDLLESDATPKSSNPATGPNELFAEDVRRFKLAKRERSTSNTNDMSSTASHAGERSRVRFADPGTALPSSQASDSTTSPQQTKVSSLAIAKGSSPQSNSRKRLFTFHEPSPSTRTVVETFSLFSVARTLHPEPFFSDPQDLPARPREYAGRMFQFQSRTLPYLRPFEHWHKSSTDEASKQAIPRKLYWQFGPPPPTMLEARAWRQKEKIVEKQRSKNRRARLLSQIERNTQSNDYGFKISQHKTTTLVVRDKQHMTTLAVEVLTTTRAGLFPDPAFDAIQAVMYSFQNEDENLQDTGSRPDLRTGLILVANEGFRAERLGLSHLAIEVVEDELDLFNALVDLMRAFDPEILVGWEIHSSSWGYIIERASKEFEFDLVPQFGRSIVHNTGRAGGKSDNYAYTQSSALRITGRHTLNLWRLMKGELTLNLYTLENVCYHLLHRRVPKFSHQTLTEWYKSGRAELVRRALLYYVEMVELELEIIAESEFVLRTAEFARIYGIDFFSVISRGSQFKVESIMLRIAKPENFVLISPSRAQVGKQNAAECLPLIMEPQSAFYKGPLIVLDFQSLYPSIMIAYNLCYSTCLGRVAGFKGTSKLGVTEYAPPKGLLSDEPQSAAGEAQVRKGVLAVGAAGQEAVRGVQVRDAGRARAGIRCQGYRDGAARFPSRDPANARGMHPSALPHARSVARQKLPAASVAQDPRGPAAVSSRRMLADPRSEPQYGERVPYIISQGEPRAKLNQQAVSPEAFLKNPQLQINALYYITRTIIPPLARVFNLLGADVEAWFHEMPKPTNAYWNKRPTAALLAAITSSDSASTDTAGPSTVGNATLNSHYATETRKHVPWIASAPHAPHFERPTSVECVSLDCPYTYQKTKLNKNLEDTTLVHTYLDRLFDSDPQRQAQVLDAWRCDPDPDATT